MGLYDNFMLPSSGQYISTYAGKPIQELAALGETIGAAYEQGIAGVSAFDIARQNATVSSKDTAFRDDLFDRVGKELKSFSKEGNYEDALPAIISSSTAISGNKNLKKAMAGHEAIQKQMLYAEEALRKGDIERFQYNLIKDELGKYKGVLEGDNAQDHMYTAAKSINMYDRFMKSGKGIEKGKIAGKPYRDPNTGNIVYPSIEGRKGDEVDFILNSTMNSDPEMRAYIADLEAYYGKDEAAKMIQSERDSAYLALTENIVDNQYVKDRRGGNNNNNNKSDEANQIAFFRGEDVMLDTETFKDLNKANKTEKALVTKETNKLAEINALLEKNPKDEYLIRKVAEQERRLETITNSYNESSQYIDEITESIVADYDFESEFKDFNQRIDDSIENPLGSEREGTTHNYDFPNRPKNVEEFKEMLLKNTGLYGEKSNFTNMYVNLFVDEYSKKIKKKLTSSLDDQKVASRGFLISGGSTALSTKIEKQRSIDFNDGKLKGFTLEENGRQVSEWINNGLKKADGMEYKIVLTTDKSKNGLPVYILNINDGKGNTTSKRLISNDPYVNASMTREMNEIMYDVIQTKGGFEEKPTDPEKIIAQNYMMEDNFLPDIRNSGGASGRKVQLGNSIPDGSPNGAPIYIQYKNTGEYAGEGNGVFRVEVTLSDGSVESMDYKDMNAAARGLFNMSTHAINKLTLKNK